MKKQAQIESFIAALALPLRVYISKTEDTSHLWRALSSSMPYLDLSRSISIAPKERFPGDVKQISDEQFFSSEFVLPV
jgi:hypothetical protein